VEVIVVELADGLSIALPVQLAREQLRPLVSKSGMRHLQETLRKESPPRESVWVKRQKETQAKLSSGDLLEVAEVVRDGARHQQALTPRGTKADISPTERDLYQKARRLLSGEVGLVRGLDTSQAGDWIDQQIAATNA
jgi:CarD family transcriptional regulator